MGGVISSAQCAAGCPEPKKPVLAVDASCSGQSSPRACQVRRSEAGPRAANARPLAPREEFAMVMIPAAHHHGSARPNWQEAIHNDVPHANHSVQRGSVYAEENTEGL